MHPYEEPVFDLYPIANEWSRSGSGITGVLPEPMPEQEFLYLLKDLLPSHNPALQAQGKEIRMWLSVVVPAFLIPKAIGYGADAFVTRSQHNDFDVEDKMLLAVVGHYDSEICTKEIFFDHISKKFPTFALHKSAFDSNPVKYL